MLITEQTLHTEEPVEPTVARDAHLIGLLLLVAHVLDETQAAFAKNDSARAAQAATSLIAHGVKTYGTSKNLRAQTLSLAKERGFDVEIVDARHAPYAQA